MVEKSSADHTNRKENLPVQRLPCQRSLRTVAAVLAAQEVVVALAEVAAVAVAEPSVSYTRRLAKFQSPSCQESMLISGTFLRSHL